jgi:hypothetical protein
MLRRAIPALIAVALLVVLAPPPAAGDAKTRRCWQAMVIKRKTSLGAHQWTIEHRNTWCAEVRDGRRRIVSVSRRVHFETGTNWRLVGRSGAARKTGPGVATSHTSAHFRLRYPQFEQNCFPRIATVMTATGGFDYSVDTGC